MIVTFLACLDKIIRVKNATEKHQFEVDAIEDVMNDCRGIYGEKCRDFIRYLNNLQKHFTEVTKTSQQLQTTAETWFDSFMIERKEHNKRLEAEKQRADKLQAVINVRNGEVQILKTEIQNLI